MITQPNQPPTDLISMAADGRLKSCDCYLGLIADRQKTEMDIASMEAQLKTSGRSEEWRNTCLYNLSCARGKKKAIEKSIDQIHEVCRLAGQIHPLCPPPIQSTETQNK